MVMPFKEYGLTSPTWQWACSSARVMVANGNARHGKGRLPTCDATPAARKRSAILASAFLASLTAAAERVAAASSRRRDSSWHRSMAHACSASSRAMTA